MQRVVRLFLAIEAAAFGVAVLIHAGVLVRGFEHREAAIAESVIGLVLLLGLLGTAVVPHVSRAIGVGCQAFALLGTLVGIFTIAIGIGPRTTLDFALHTGFVILLITGLASVARTGHTAGLPA